MINKHAFTIAAYRLAKHNGHAWAQEITLDSDWDYTIPADTIEAAIKTMDPLGIDPANDHITGSGRASWSMSLESGTIQIHRPATIVGGLDGSITVLKATIDLDGRGLITDATIRSSSLAEPRHWKELLSYLQLLGIDDCDSDNATRAWRQCVCGSLGYSLDFKVDFHRHYLPAMLRGDLPDARPSGEPSPLLQMPAHQFGVVMRGEQEIDSSAWSLLDAAQSEHACQTTFVWSGPSRAQKAYYDVAFRVIEGEEREWIYADPDASPCDRYLPGLFKIPDHIAVKFPNGDIYDSTGGPDGPSNGITREGSPVHQALVASGVKLEQVQ
jgi:hypothetical protein